MREHGPSGFGHGKTKKKRRERKQGGDVGAMDGGLEDRIKELTVS